MQASPGHVRAGQRRAFGRASALARVQRGHQIEHLVGDGVVDDRPRGTVEQVAQGRGVVGVAGVEDERAVGVVVGLLRERRREREVGAHAAARWSIQSSVLR